MALRFLFSAGWILVAAVSSNVETALNPDDECAANARDCSVEFTQLRGMKHDVLSRNEPFNASAFASGTGLLSIMADSATDGCDWSSKEEFCKNWKTCVCGKKVTALDVGELEFKCVAVPALCASEAANMFKEVIGASVATKLVKQMLEQKSQVSLPSGKSAKAAILSGIRCKHCALSWACYPIPNEHRLCVAWDKNSASAPRKRSLLFIL